MIVKINDLCQALGHTFNDEKLLYRALTHRSASKAHNERFEFLGDSLLNLIIADALFHKFTDLTEGDLSRMRAQLVKADTLSALAIQFKLFNYIQVSDSERISQGHKNPSILADAIEAIIAAIYIDAGFTTTKQRVLDWFDHHLNSIGLQNQKDPKTTLQELLQSIRNPTPQYELVDTTGPHHNQIFKINCIIKLTTIPFIGTGRNRRTAEQIAAAKAVDYIKAEHPNIASQLAN